MITLYGDRKRIQARAKVYTTDLFFCQTDTISPDLHYGILENIQIRQMFTAAFKGITVCCHLCVGCVSSMECILTVICLRPCM